MRRRAFFDATKFFLQNSVLEVHHYKINKKSFNNTYNFKNALFVYSFSFFLLNNNLQLCALHGLLLLIQTSSSPPNFQLHITKLTVILKKIHKTQVS